MRIASIPAALDPVALGPATLVTVIPAKAVSFPAASAPAAAPQKSDWTVTYNGSALSMELRNQNGRLLAPAWQLGTAMGGSVVYCVPQVVNIYANNQLIELSDGKSSYTVGGQSKSACIAPVTVNYGTLYVSVRDLADMMNVQLSVNNYTKTVTLTKSA